MAEKEIVSRRWCLSRADSSWANDTHEMTESGKFWTVVKAGE